MKNKFIINKCKRLRKKIKNVNLNRLFVKRTNKHIYANILSIDQKNIEVSASTIEKSIKKELNIKKIYTGNKISSEMIGKIIAIRSITKGIKNVYFDRSGLKFHGRIKSLADSARKYGLNF